MPKINDIDNIQRDLAKVQRDIKSTLNRYKQAEGDRKKRYVEELKKLQEKRKELDAKLEAAIESMHSDAELEDIDELTEGKLEDAIDSQYLGKFRTALADVLNNLRDAGYGVGDYYTFVDGQVENIAKIHKKRASRVNELGATTTRRMQGLVNVNSIRDLKSALAGIRTSLMEQEAFEADEVREFIMKYVNSIIV